MSSSSINSAYTRTSDEVYQVICRAINIDSDREQYTKAYDFVRHKVFDGLKEDRYFKALSCGMKLCGSYADNLKISKPNEFDLLLHLKFPHNDEVIIHKDTFNIGNVFIDLSNVLAQLIKDKNIEMYTFLKGFVNTNDYFLLDRFQFWLEGRVTKVINDLDCPVYHLGKRYNLKYRKQGPAHTIEVNNGLNEFAIDFVPAFRFEKIKAVSERKPTERWWEAIPKPTNGRRTNPSFRASYTDSERPMFHNCNQFKNTLRLMKKFRDMNPKLGDLKSYYLKTIFLWHYKETSNDFWNSSITDIVHVMFGKLEEALRENEIKYFWDDDLNLLNNLRPSQVDSMYHVVRIARKALESATCSQHILDIFLTKEEQADMPEEDQEIIQNSFMDQAKSVVYAGLGIFAVTALATGIYKFLTAPNDDNPPQGRIRTD